MNRKKLIKKIANIWYNSGGKSEEIPWQFYNIRDAVRKIEKKHEDHGKDISHGDIVWIRCKVDSYNIINGKVDLTYLPKNGRGPVSGGSKQAIFLRRPRSLFLKWLVNLIFRSMV